jgi:hypothetical protein
VDHLLIRKRQVSEEAQVLHKRRQQEFVARLRNSENVNEKQSIIGQMKELNLLQESDLSNLDLSGMILFKANMRDANLSGTNFEGTRFEEVDLRGAILAWAILDNAMIEKVAFDNSTILPNGKQWHDGTNLRRLTNPHYPDDWFNDMPAIPYDVREEFFRDIYGDKPKVDKPEH